MKTINFTIILYSILLNTSFSQPIPQDSLYLGQTRPGLTPVLFQLPISGETPVQ